MTSNIKFGDALMSMFKVGDKIIFAAMSNSVMKYQKCLEILISQGLIRHATSEEIAVGHRIDLETLRDCDTSPNCKKYDERVK